jgi:ParB-like chromosome segregation protein Spo0J
VRRIHTKIWRSYLRLPIGMARSGGGPCMVNGNYDPLSDVRKLPTITIDLGRIRSGELLRSNGIDEHHVRLLMDCDDELPPILVQQNTMRVIDGMHRLHAARAMGRSRISAHLIEVDDNTAFLYGVAANITHGLPLSLADRRAAALRMMQLYPEWSDRALGRVCGLSGKTVAALRARDVADADTPNRRIGLDGRVRPVDGTLGRRVARELLAAKPTAPLRQIAREAGVSPGTVHRVRIEMGLASVGRAGPTPLQPAGITESWRGPRRPVSDRPAPDLERQMKAVYIEMDPRQILENLRQDPSLKYRDKGRELLRLLHPRPVLEVGREFVDVIPAHCVPAIARLTRLYAQEWLILANMLENRARQEVA